MKTDPNQREAILKAASEVFSKKGYVKTSLEAIAELAGSDTETIKRLYGSKSELGAVWLNMLHAGSVKRHAEILSAATAPERKIRDYFEELKRGCWTASFLAVRSALSASMNHSFVPRPPSRSRNTRPMFANS